MKKTLAILLVLVMVFSLVSCASNKGPENGDPVNANTTASSQPEQSNQPVQPSQPEQSNQPVTSGQPSNPAAATVGFPTDDVDHWARDPYHIVYFNFRPSNITQQFTISLEKMGEVYNYTLEQLTANNDSDMFINTLQTILNKRPDGVIVDITQELASRTATLCADYDVPVVCLMNTAVDANGVALIPSVVMDEIKTGNILVEIMAESYRDYWGDIDTSEIGLLTLDWSANVSVNKRTIGAETKFNELFPGNPVFYADSTAGGMSVQSGFDLTNSILSTNPDVKYWFITAAIEDIGLGGLRAAQGLDMEDRILMTGAGATILPAEWNEGYEGNWIAAYGAIPIMYAGNALCGLLALIDGRATTDTLWPEYIQQNHKAALFYVDGLLLTRDTYRKLLDDAMLYFGVEPF